jgi:branched-subunit amino acid aminotransferase/4-amino-4-deoxychorismate lyase
MYNSDLDMLIEGNLRIKNIGNDQDLMVFPIDDRLANRAHGAMETGNVKNYRISSLDFHMDRLFRSAEIIGLKIDLTKE